MTAEREVFVYPLQYGDALDGQYWVPVNYQRLLTSRWRHEAMKPENREAAVFGVLLWFESYRQDPPGTLPTDDLEVAGIAGLAGFPSDWARLRNFAMRDWHVCHVLDAEGEPAGERLYHQHVLSVAMECSKRKRRTAAARESSRVNKRRSRVAAKLREMPFMRGAPPVAAVHQIAAWIEASGGVVTTEAVRAGWDMFIVKGDSSAM